MNWYKRQMGLNWDKAWQDLVIELERDPTYEEVLERMYKNTGLDLNVYQE